MTILNRYLRAIDGFDRTVAAVATERWDGPSACSAWTNRDVLGHVVWGQHLVRHLATGVAFADRTGAPGAAHPGSLVPADPVGTWRAARDASVATMTADALERVVELRGFGAVPLSEFLAALVGDTLAHGWDIGVATGQAVRLDPELVAFGSDWASAAPLTRSPAAFGPAVEVPAGADEQTRFLALLGRRALRTSTA